ncbi:MAG: alpha/beta hydrolase [bacterium]|nr:alpha/beta hydrolase [Gammaproteobacteria bacterium]HIL97587.1 alpha/beta hydrolase [Pseudomonadales bacterium]
MTALLNHLDVEQPLILIGCSMGGGLALDYALTHPDNVRALILVDSAPSGLQIDVPTPAKFKLVEDAENAGDLDLVAEIETQIWFDGDRKPGDVNQEMRELAFVMNRIALSHDAKGLGKQLSNTETPAVGRLRELSVPVLAIVGADDIPYMHAAVDYMAEEISTIQKETIKNAAHLPNMDQPDEFERIVVNFIEDLSSVRL